MFKYAVFITLFILVTSIAIYLSSYKGCDSPRPQNNDIYTKNNNMGKVSSYKDCYNILILSSGATNGAWGAGVLNGWKDRPKFDIVSGVSTGSLLAVAAFLDDEKYNRFIKDKYTNLDTKNMFSTLAIAEGYLNQKDIKIRYPLKDMIHNSITDDMIEKVSKQENRYLYIGATNMDKGCLDIFDMVKIAKSKDYNRFRDILLASCSIPLVLPPVYIDGFMYYDGGVTESAFIRDYFFPNEVKTINVFLIFNGRPSSSGGMIVKNNPKDITIRLLSVMNSASQMLVVHKIQNVSNKNGCIFNFCFVPDNVNLLGLDATQKQMKELYESGYLWGQKNIWNHDIPDSIKD